MLTGIAAILLLLAAFYKSNKTTKIVYVDTVFLYQNSKIKKHYSDLLGLQEKSNNYYLDSLARIYKNSKENTEVLNYTFDKKKRELSFKLSEIEKGYNAKIWNQISDYTLEYGKTNDYDFIIGANGQGSIMYAKEANNISEKVLEFINEKYSDD